LSAQTAGKDVIPFGETVLEPVQDTEIHVSE